MKKITSYFQKGGITADIVNIDKFKKNNQPHKKENWFMFIFMSAVAIILATIAIKYMHI